MQKFALRSALNNTNWHSPIIHFKKSKNEICYCFAGKIFFQFKFKILTPIFLVDGAEPLVRFSSPSLSMAIRSFFQNQEN